jgi:hypothetical protein
VSNNYSKLSPIAKYGFPDYKRGSSKWYDFLEEEEYRCLNGYTAGGITITGRHYFKLNWTKIGIVDAYGNKVPTYPYFADAQKEFYDTIEYCLANERNLIGLKGRDKGWTYDVAAVALYEMMMMQFSSVMALFPGGTNPAKDNFRKAYDMAYNEMDVDFKQPVLRATNSSKNTHDSVEYGWEETNEETGEKSTEGNRSKLDIMIAVNPSVVRSGRSKFIILDELGEIEDALDIVNVADAVMREGAKKFGMIIAGGTSNAFKSETGFKNFRELWYNADTYSFEKIFIPANKQYWGFVNYQTGESDLEGAKAHRMAIRAKKKGRDLLIEKQEYPFDESEAFYRVDQSPFNPDKANEQIARILSSKDITGQIQRGGLFNKKNDKGELRPVFELFEGDWQIFKHPAEGLAPLNKIVGAVDSYRLQDVTDSDSKGAIEIYVPFQGINKPGNYPIAIYRGRPATKEEFFEQCLLAAIYWDCRLLIEYTDEDIITYFRQHNAVKWLKERPQAVVTKYSNAGQKYGVHPTQHNRAVALEMAIQDFDRNYDQIVFVDLLDEMLKFGTENTDRVWAHNWAVLHGMDNIRVLDEYKEKKKPKPFMPYTVRDGTGNLISITSPEKARQMGLRV